MQKKCKWTLESLEEALEEIQQGKLSVRAAASKYDIPKSTIHDHVKHHDREARPGPSPILTKTEEGELVKWIVDMSATGYGQCHQQVCLMVKKILDHEERITLFQTTYLGRIAGMLFLEGTLSSVLTQPIF